MTKQKTTSPTISAIMAGLQSIESIADIQALLKEMRTYQIELRTEKPAVYDGLLTEAQEIYREMQAKNGDLEAEMTVYNMKLDRLRRHLEKAHAEGRLTKAFIARASQPTKDTLFTQRDKEGNIISVGLLESLPENSVQPYNDLVAKYYKIVKEQTEDQYKDANLKTNCMP